MIDKSQDDSYGNGLKVGLSFKSISLQNLLSGKTLSRIGPDVEDDFYRLHLKYRYL